MENIIHPSLGSKLRERREEKQLSIEEVAQQLRLKKALIEDIETGNYERIPLAYLRGYLRAYAKLLSIQDLELLPPIELANYPSNSWQMFNCEKQLSASDKIMQWITFVIVSALILLVALWWKSDHMLYKNISANEPTPDKALYYIAQNTINGKN